MTYLRRKEAVDSDGENQIAVLKQHIGEIRQGMGELKKQVAILSMGKKGIVLGSTSVVVPCVGCMLGMLVVVLCKM